MGGRIRPRIVHVHDELVADRRDRRSGGVHEHPGAVDRHVALRITEKIEDRGRVRLDRALDLQPLNRH
jgi:hypothetical protein